VFNLKHTHCLRDLGTAYWIGRNSWGSFWGEGGWFKIIRGAKNYDLGIETDCVWGVPILPK
jgi:cathepsin X